MHKSLRDFRPLRYSSRDGHAEGEYVNRGRDTASFCPTLQVLDSSFLLRLSWLLRSRVWKFRRDLWITLYMELQSRFTRFWIFETSMLRIHGGALTCAQWSPHVRTVEPSRVHSGALTCAKWSPHVCTVEPSRVHSRALTCAKWSPHVCTVESSRVHSGTLTCAQLCENGFTAKC
jgi:hypothetical protein